MTKESAVDRLTSRQRYFAEEYVIDFNGRQAAIRAGYLKASASHGDSPKEETRRLTS